MANSVRIRMDGKFSHRKETVEEVTEFYGAGKTRALMLTREDLTAEQRRKIATTFDRVGRFDVDAGLDEPAIRTGD